MKVYDFKNNGRKVYSIEATNLRDAKKQFHQVMRAKSVFAEVDKYKGNKTMQKKIWNNAMDKEVKRKGMRLLR
jgi:hypothetical protein